MSSRVGASAVAVTASIGRIAERARDLLQAQIFGAEIMAPLRDAMGLVDRDEIDAILAEPLQRLVARQALGRDIEQAQRAILQRGVNALAFGRVGGGIQRGGGNAEFAQLRDLIAHQRDQRRDDQGQRAAHDRRQLEQQRLAAAGRHDREHVLAREHRAQDLLLAGAEVGKAVDARQFGSRLVDQTQGLVHLASPDGSNTGVHCTSSIRSAPQASMTSLSKPSAAPLASGISASASRKSSSIG